MFIPRTVISRHDESPDGTVVLIAADVFETETSVMILNHTISFGTDIVTVYFRDAALSAGCDQSVQVGPVSTIARARRRQSLQLYRRLCRDFHKIVAGGNIEMMNCVPREIAVLHDVRRGIDVEREAEAALVAVAARLQANFHHTLADGWFIAEGRSVTDGVDHRVIESLSHLVIERL